MDTLYTQLKVVLLLLVIILSVTVYERRDEIGGFLQNQENVATVLNPVTSFLGIPQTPERSVSTNSTVTQTQLGKLSATFICISNRVTSEGEAIIMWACPEGTENAASTNFDTKNNVIGKTHTTIGQKTTFSIDCISATKKVVASASCDIDMSSPSILLDATPRTVTRGSTNVITWDTQDINSCILSDVSDIFFKTGIRGKVTSPPIINQSSFSLVCDTLTGIRTKKTLLINGK